MTKKAQAIGVFDSGVGGLSVLQHLQENYPHEKILYLADQARVPYGSRSIQEIRDYSVEITKFLLDRGAKIIVVACNTASAAALTYLRQAFPGVPFVGMEPAVKPAAMITKTGKVGVLATPTTFASPRYSALMDRYASGVTVLEDPCVGLVDLIEKGRLETQDPASLLTSVLKPMLDSDVDTLVLGCTHYPLVLPLIESLADSLSGGRSVTIIDPAPAVARQIGRILAQNDQEAEGSREGSIRLFTTADIGTLGPLAEYALGRKYPVEEVSLHISSPDTA